MSERSLWYVFLMHGRVPNHHYPTPTFRTVSESAFSKTRLLDSFSICGHRHIGATHEGLLAEGGNYVGTEQGVIRRLYEEVWNQHNPEAADECCVGVHRDVHLIVEVVDLQARGYRGDPGDGIEALYSPGCNVPITAEEIAALPDELRFELGDALYSAGTLPAPPCGRVWTEDYTYVPESFFSGSGV